MILAVGAQDTMTHPGLADEVHDRNAGQAQGPGSEQGKGCILAQSAQARSGVEEDNRLPVRGGVTMTGNQPRQADRLQVPLPDCKPMGKGGSHLLAILEMFRKAGDR